MAGIHQFGSRVDGSCHLLFCHRRFVKEVGGAEGNLAVNMIEEQWNQRYEMVSGDDTNS